MVGHGGTHLLPLHRCYRKWGLQVRPRLNDIILQVEYRALVMLRLMRSNILVEFSSQVSVAGGGTACGRESRKFAKCPTSQTHLLQLFERIMSEENKI